MHYDGKLLARARIELENIKMKNLDEQLRRRELAYARAGAYGLEAPRSYD